MRLFALTAALALAACSMTPAADHGVASACADAPIAIDERIRLSLDAVIDAASAEGFAGQVAMMRDGAYIYRRSVGYADQAGTIPVTEETLFHVASITKYFTAALTLRAVEEGRIELDTPLAQLAPGTHLAARNTTIADLLAHRSGLGSSYAAEAHDEAQAALAAIDAVDFDSARIGGFRYSNDGYDVLGILLERLYGEPYETLLERQLLARACIRRVGFWSDSRLLDAAFRAQPLEPPAPQLRRRNYGMIASAGLLITADELAAWQHALRSGRVLSPAAMEQFTAPRDPTSIGQATFGAFLIDHPRLGRVLSARGAEDWGDNAILNDYLDCGVIVAVVTSRGPAENSGRPLFRNQISQAAEEALAELCPPPPEAPLSPRS